MWWGDNMNVNTDKNILKNMEELQELQSDDRFIWALTVYKKPQPIRSYTLPSNGVFSVKIQENTRKTAHSKVIISSLFK